MASSTPRQALISKLKKKLISLSRDHLQMIASLIDDGPAHNVDVLSAPELYILIIDFIRSEKLSSLEDEGMTQLHLLDDLISDLLASNVGAAGDDPSTPVRTQGGSASQPGCPNPICSDRESAPPDTDFPLQPTHTTSDVNTQSPAYLDSDTHTPMSQTDRDCSPARLSTAATPAESHLTFPAGAVGLSAAASTAVAGVGAGVGAGIGATAGLLAGNTNKQEEVNEEGKEKKDKEEKSDREIKDKEEKNDGEEEEDENKEEEDESDGEYKKKK